MARRIRFNAFQMNTPSHQSPGLWTHPRSDSERYLTPGYWIELAQLLERHRTTTMAYNGAFNGTPLTNANRPTLACAVRPVRPLPRRRPGPADPRGLRPR